MHTEHEALVRAPMRRMFELAADVERWPARLPHYRWVRLIRQHGDYRLVQMAASHLAIPLSWVCEVETFPEEPRIRFHHVGGATNDMVAEWLFSEQPDGVAVRVLHDLQLKWPLIGGFVGDRMMAPWFIGPISGKTLQGLKGAAEAST